LAANEKSRYPDVAEITTRAHDAGLRVVATESLASLPSQVSEGFLRNIAEKNWSMFRLLAEEEFSRGLQALTSDLGCLFESPTAGETFLWFRKDVHPIIPPDAAR